MPKPDIFCYRDYRLFMRDFVAAKKAQRGLSYRYFAAKAGFSSPSYLQQVVQGKRRLRRESAAQVVAAFHLSAAASKYFLLLVELAAAASPEERAATEMQLERLAAYASSRQVTDSGFYGSWLNAVIWELATVQGFILTTDRAHARLRGLATKKQIGDALRFLLANGYLVPTDTPHVYRQGSVLLDPMNHQECVELQNFHRAFLELAVREISGDRSLRELQNLTIAIPRTKIPLIKERLRQLTKDLQADLAGCADAELVYHVQLCAFNVTSLPDA